MAFGCYSTHSYMVKNHFLVSLCTSCQEKGYIIYLGIYSVVSVEGATWAEIPQFICSPSVWISISGAFSSAQSDSDANAAHLWFVELHLHVLEETGCLVGFCSITKFTFYTIPSSAIVGLLQALVCINFQTWILKRRRDNSSKLT